MSRAPQTKEFQQLQRIWAKKLKQSGFNDIEHDEDRLKHYVSSGLTRRLNGATRSDKIQMDNIGQEYYRLASQWYYTHKFKTPLEKKIWKWHAAGLSFRTIAKKLVTSTFRANKDNINIIVRRLAAEMLAEARNSDD